MSKLRCYLAGLCLAISACVFHSASAEVTLGEAPLAPQDVSGLPGRRAHPLIVTGNLNVDTSSREQVREFYNAVYLASEGTPAGSTAITADCFPGTNSPAFINATLLRINWFRAMGGVPASVTFDPGESADDQAAALMFSEHDALQHVGDWTGWDCFSTDGTNASANSNIALGYDGPDAITGYIWDFGASNYEVGHRRYILYPQTQVMATGDVPPETSGLNSYNAANATWIFDANYFVPRPATREPFVAWPPAGYAPYQVVYPQWSFALSNADLSAATVTMASNGVPMAVVQQIYAINYGENTLVWYPISLDPTLYTTAFPFDGTDTVYTITVNNIVTSAGTSHFSYNVTVFDPATTGTGYFALSISGTNQPAINAGNPYCCTPATNPNTTGYQWLTAQTTNGDLIDKALNGLTNFTVSPTPPPYPIITTAPVTGGGNCFHLCHTNPVPQLLQLNERLFPATNTTVSFKSLLGYSTLNEIARVQVATDGGTNWQNIYTQAGTNGPGETAFTQHTLSLSNYAGSQVLLRFNYDLPSGTYYPETNNYVGWCLENMVVTNTLQLLNLITNATASTNFTFIPTQTNTYLLQARGLIFDSFPVDWGIPKLVTAIIGPPVIAVNSLVITSSQIKLNFELTSGQASTFHLLQASQLSGPWTTNSTAVLTTITPGSIWQYTTTNGPATRFYRIQTP